MATYYLISAATQGRYSGHNRDLNRCKWELLEDRLRVVLHPFVGCFHAQTRQPWILPPHKNPKESQLRNTSEVLQQDLKAATVAVVSVNGQPLLR